MYYNDLTMKSNVLGLTLLGAAVHERVTPKYTDWPFHNQQHADQVTLDAMKLANYCEKNGLSSDRSVILVAAQYHDALFHEHSLGSGFSSAERQSAAIAMEESYDLGFTDSQIEHVGACIESTERGVSCQSLEAKIIRRADLANLGGSLGGFVISSFKLYNELHMQKRFPGDWISLIQGSRASLADYLSEDISFGEFDRHHNKSLWLIQTERNLRILDRIVAQPAESANTLLNKILERASSINRAAS